MKEKKNDLILVDTGVLLKFLLGEEGKETIRELLIKIVSGEVRGFISVVTLSELVTICIRRKKEFLIPTILEFIHQNFTIVDTTSEVAILGGYFKAKYSKKKETLSHADSILLACGFLYSCILLTYDSEFDKVKDVVIQTPEKFLMGK